MQAMVHQSETDYSYNQRHSALVSRAESMAHSLARSTLSTHLALQKILGQAESAQRKLEDAKRSLSGSENGGELLEMSLKMQSSVEQCLAGLSKEGKKKKNQRQTGAGKGARGRK